MRKLFIGFAFAVLVATPAMAQLALTGDEALAVVTKGEIKATSALGTAGFLLFIEYAGKRYVCNLTGRGQVTTCDPLHW